MIHKGSLMSDRIILASGSDVRKNLLVSAGVNIEAEPAKIDESMITASMTAAGFTPNDIADGLADAKAQKVSKRHPDAMVIGCDQVLECGGKLFSKPKSKTDAIEQLSELSGQQHRLLSAVVLYENGVPQWRYLGVANLHMRQPSNQYLVEYVGRNWPSIGHSVGCYKLEEEGIRLFTKIDGDYFTILGLPLVQLLGYLTERGRIQG